MKRECKNENGKWKINMNVIRLRMLASLCFPRAGRPGWISKPLLFHCLEQHFAKKCSRQWFFNDFICPGWTPEDPVADFKTDAFPLPRAPLLRNVALDNGFSMFSGSARGARPWENKRLRACKGFTPVSPSHRPRCQKTRDENNRQSPWRQTFGK